MTVVTQLRRPVPMSTDPIRRTFTIVEELRRPLGAPPAWYVKGPCEPPAFATRFEAQIFVVREVEKYSNGSITPFVPTHSILWWPPQSPEIRWNIPVRMLVVPAFPNIPAALYKEEDWKECVQPEWTFDINRDRLLLDGTPMGGNWTLIEYVPPIPPEPPRPPAPDEVLYMLNAYFSPGSTLFTTASNSSLATVYKVRMVGGGGGGGGTGGVTGGGGGGAGQYKEFIINNRPANSQWLLAVGAGGVGTNMNGAAGSNTTINIGGQVIVCAGGGGGPAGLSTDGIAGGGVGGSGGATPGISGLTLVMDVPGQSATISIARIPSIGGSTLLGLGGRVFGEGPGMVTLPSGAGAGGAGGAGGVGSSGAAGGIIIERMDG